MHIRWRGLELPSLITCDPKTLTNTYGKFTAEPFERGFGVTIGNGLRRILLSSLEGSAVTQIKVQGAQHEFTTLPGVVEDMTDVVLNIKSLVVKNNSDQMKVITVEKNTAGEVTGADIQTGGEIEVINQNHVLATLTEDVPWDELKGQIETGNPDQMLHIRNKPKHNACIELSREYNLAPSSIPVLLDPANWHSD